MAGTRYKVYITPLASRNVYGSEIEVTDYILDTGLANIRRAIDSNDYDVGVFTYEDLNVSAYNLDGYFNESTDQRSIFGYSRDLAKVRVEYHDTASGETIVFRGLVNEEGTRVNASTSEITFKVLSRDSVIRNTLIAGGVISDGMLCSAAMLSILSDAKIASVLTIDALNLAPDLDFTIDVGSFFDGSAARDSLNLLLLASNSVLLIDDTDTVFVQSRAHDPAADVTTLYGPTDLKRRQNVIDLADYNSGLQRMFTSIKVNDTEVSNESLLSAYGSRQKDMTLDFITSAATAELIAEALLSEFQAPKIEMRVTVPTSVARNLDLLSVVSINWPLRVKPIAGFFLPIVGDAVIGDVNTPLPNTYGSLRIDPEYGFKVIEIVESPKDFVTTLKLRQIGTTISDGTLTGTSSSLIGFAIINESVIGGTGDVADGFNPSVIGAALVGSTEAA